MLPEATRWIKSGVIVSSKILSIFVIIHSVCSYPPGAPPCGERHYQCVFLYILSLHSLIGAPKSEYSSHVLATLEGLQAAKHTARYCEAHVNIRRLRS